MPGLCDVVWWSVLALGLLLVPNPVSAQADLRSALGEYVSEADDEDIGRLSYLMFEWPWQDVGIRGFLGRFGVTEKPEPLDDPRAALLELVNDGEPDDLDILAYLRRGLEAGQDLAACFDQADQASCVSRVMDEADRALALDTVPPLGRRSSEEDAGTCGGGPEEDAGDSPAPS